VKPPLTTVAKTVGELKQTWVSVLTGWTQPAPIIDRARKVQQLVTERDWEDWGVAAKWTKKPGH
jgi:hypothetical protein